jgi:hypothetical protein
MYALTYILLIVKYLFLMSSCVTSQLEMNMSLLPFVVHISCVDANGGQTDDSKDARGMIYFPSFHPLELLTVCNWLMLSYCIVVSCTGPS